MDNASNTNKSIHLSASAGSGKTRALKERYLALLDVLDDRGLNIDQAVAITFTDKAAAEIKERVMHDLPEAMLKKIIRGRQDLRISTIHSFCMNLLKRYPLEAGLPPDFGVLDARDQAYKVQQAIEDTLEASDRDLPVMSPLRDFTVNDLLSTIEFLLSIRSRLKRMEIDAGGPDGLARSVRTGMGFDRTGSELKALVTSADWRAILRQMELILRSQGDLYQANKGNEHLLLSEANIDAALRASESLVPIYFTKEGTPRKNPSITKKDFTGKDRADYERAFFAIQEGLGRFRALHSRLRAGQETLSLLTLFQRAEERYQSAKLREGLLDFDDLEIYTYRLLQGLESPDILYWLDRKVLHVLVDEFQDTSDIQWAIMNKLTEETFAGQGADKRMPPTLFVVGDEKQSIYRFREANYRLIENVKQRILTNLPPESREVLTLDQNFRSTPEIVETVNRVFSALWGEAYKPSAVVRKDHQGSVRLMELAPSFGEGPSGPTEADALAQEIKALIAGDTLVYEKSLDPRAHGKRGTNKSGWTERNAGYGDCAILIQSRTKLKEYEAALQKENIPYRVVGGIGFYEEEEVQALINVLFFLWNQEDRLSLAAALRSRLFGLSDGEIYSVMQGGVDLVAALEDRRPDAGKLVRDWMGLAGLLPLAGLMHRIVNETGAYVRFGRKNPQAIFNIDKLLDAAREFDRRGYTTLQDFVEWVRNIRQTEQREATADMNLPGFQGSVSILTVHKAKGLEYPIVFLPGMNQQPKSLTTGPLAIIEDANSGLRMAIKDAASPVYDELWDREHDELLREHQRMLYVAMTRARDHLVMIGALADNRTPIKANTWLDYVQRASQKPLFDSKTVSDTGSTIYACPPPASSRGNNEVRSGPRDEERTRAAAGGIDVKTVMDNLSPVPRSEALEWKKATDFIHQEKEGAIETLSIQAGERAVSPLTRGSMLHRCLEEFTKTGAYNLDRIMMEYEDLLALRDDARQSFVNDANSVLRSVLNKDEHRWVFEQQPNAFSELPFLYKKGRSLVSGIIDRVVIRDNKGYVIDYKSLLIENADALGPWLDHYSPQIRIYCEAVKHIFALENVDGYLLFLGSNRLELCSPRKTPPAL